jgi:type III pantothenate kinase
MTKTLCLDFGNTRKKAALFEGEKLAELVPLVDEKTETIQALVRKFQPQRSILASVVNHEPALEDFLRLNTGFLRLDHMAKLPFTTPVGKPETIGADRLALAAAAVTFHPGKNILVIALGTCITYNFINKFREFVGGSISPGMEMRLKALHHYTARLPLVKATSNVPLVGYDTTSNILSGVVLGMANEIDGFIDAYRDRYRNFNVLLTGGDTVHLASHLKNRIFADPELIFKGLYGISAANNP